MKYDNSPKLSPKAMKLALESSFYLKIKNESNRLIGIGRDDRTPIEFVGPF